MSALPIPSSRPGQFVLALVLVDIPVIAAVVVVGFFYGYQDTFWGIMGWRESHPWSYLPSVVVALVLARRWWHR